MFELSWKDWIKSRKSTTTKGSPRSRFVPGAAEMRILPLVLLDALWVGAMEMCSVFNTNIILSNPVLSSLFSLRAFHTSCKFLVKDDGMETRESSSSPWGDECREISYANLFCHTCTSFSVGVNECTHVISVVWHIEGGFNLQYQGCVRIHAFMRFVHAQRAGVYLSVWQ
jgi:hypothetical protein